MAEHARAQAGLRYVAIFRHAAGSHSPLEELARASMLELGEMERIRAAGHAAVRGMRRFARRAVTLEGGVYVVAAEMDGGEVVSVVASGAAGGKLPAEMNAALVDLVQVAARVLAEPRPPAQASGGYGTRFGEALAFLGRPPVLAQSRRRVVHALEQRHAAVGEAIEVVETDVGLASAVLGAANQKAEGAVASVPAAIEALGAPGTLQLAAALPTLRPAAPGERMSIALARITSHSIAVRAAAQCIAEAVGERGRDELRLAAVLHDVGKVALVGLRDGYMSALTDHSSTPEDRIAAERRRLAVDHATIGGLALRRLGAPRSLVMLVECHHGEEATGRAAILRLADMLAHVAHGDPVGFDALTSVARRLSLDEGDLQAMVYALQRTPLTRSLAAGPSPLTEMQEKALRGLADGKRYKQIAADLELAESTVRSHVHNLYRRLGVADRAHAVLLASERGWI